MSVKVNIKITEEKEILLKEKFGKAIEAIPGKTEAALMITFEDEQKMYFRGKNDKPIAFVEIKLLGKAPLQSLKDMTALVCDILDKEMGIPTAQTYVKYEEVEYWGYIG